ncbi:AFR179Cp [Eremothecium gossypii ATCC 10895]|uniref:AFR179Cp n=1 Tax=Eremothecium gossypii (strain ATCC 10895 / CBS 109.51 / FGSC 9923 / NRRL Y-1056) TaxID=284811 RepID=Q753Z3_EREGS|nr:AFR179Cp [Eremothecium gossypii ATCC 10895]AAS53550.2 AFR179Cp [Eremothecium gossypii ATCC 10895]AEY97863.1 FAFR179Cp [Eremothecium gossypii FDAG1]
MARKKHSRGKGAKKTFGARNDSNAQKDWTELVKENEKWENYYKQLGVVPEAEWEDFKKTCQTQLPLTFRITGSRKHAQEVLELFENEHLPKLTNVVWDGEKVEAPKALPWYGDNMAWQLDVSKSVIRKNEEFSKMQRFLVVENAVGNISRQEAVSMIPPIVLGVEPHHSVLDMCAAPGSKTAQLVEALHANGPEPSGFVVANDADYRRSHMLVHQLKRLNSANLIVVNHDAQFFPRIKTAEGSKDFLKFDRVLCDVPCSGDGTMRKNINVWKDWGTGSGLGLHTVQLNILNRGLTLLKNGGRLVYSTCSLNPIENEAVVAAALRKWGAKIKLVNCDDQLLGLVRSTGISSWPVLDKNYEEKNKGDDGTIATWFPPSEEEAKEFNLENCIRVYPHQQNTGGFFISVFEKINTEPVETAQDEKSEEPEQKKQKHEPAPKKERLPRDANEEPFVFVSPTHPELANCWSFYGVDDAFDRNTCLVRNAAGEPTRVIYHVATPLKYLIEANEDRLKIVYSGIKLFVSQRSDVGCSWRIQSEALPIMQHHMNDARVVDTNLEMLKKLLLEAFPRFEDMQEAHIDDDFIAKMSSLSSGCAFIRVTRGQDKEGLFLPLWNGNKCVNLMVCKEDTHELLYRVFGIETTSKQNPKAEAQAKAQEEKAAALADKDSPQESAEDVQVDVSESAAEKETPLTAVHTEADASEQV